jgi:hypothetical protein
MAATVQLSAQCATFFRNSGYYHSQKCRAGLPGFTLADLDAIGTTGKDSKKGSHFP